MTKLKNLRISFSLFSDQNFTSLHQFCNNDLLTSPSNSKPLQNGKLNRDLELKAAAGLSLFPMDWLNSNGNTLPIWSAASANNLSTANSNLAASNLALSNLASNLPNSSNPETGSLAANLPGQSNGNQLAGPTPGQFSSSLAGQPSLYSSLLSQNYLIPFLKNAALIANLANSSMNNAAAAVHQPNSVNSNSSLSDDQWTGRNQEENHRKSISSLDSKPEKENCRGGYSLITRYEKAFFARHCLLNNRLEINLITCSQLFIKLARRDLARDYLIDKFG